MRKTVLSLILLVAFTATGEFQNPVLGTGLPFADPAVVKANDGYFYAYATQLPSDQNWINVQTARSSDLINWTMLPDSLPERPDWAKKNQNVWAPHVEVINGKYVLYVSIQENNNNFSIAAATSDNPAGPFTDLKPLVRRNSFEAIDPSTFRDPKTGKLYLTWGSASKPLYIQELNDDGLSLKKGSQPRKLLSPILEPRGSYQAADGFTYGFGTQLGPEGDGKFNIQARRSRDGVEWEALGDAMPNRPKWAAGKPDHFAPQVIKVGSEYLMYTTFETHDGKFAIAVGSGRSPHGPFDNFAVLQDRLKDRAIPFVAKHEGKLKLYWEDNKPETKRVFYRELEAHGRSFSEEKLQVAKQAKPWMKVTKEGYDHLIEAGWLSYKNGYYYLYYSGDECCSKYAHYAVSVARSKTLEGPFERMSEAKGTNDSVILKSSSKWIGPGHHSIIEDHAGREWIMFHAIPSDNFFSQVTKDRKEPYRALLMDEITYDSDGWPVISETKEVRSVIPRRPTVTVDQCRAIFR